MMDQKAKALIEKAVSRTACDAEDCQDTLFLAPGTAHVPGLTSQKFLTKNLIFGVEAHVEHGSLTAQVIVVPEDRNKLRRLLHGESVEIRTLGDASDVDVTLHGESVHDEEHGDGVLLQFEHPAGSAVVGVSRNRAIEIWSLAEAMLAEIDASVQD